MARKVIFIPAGEPWQKSKSLTASAIERANLVSKAIANTSEYELSTREIDRNGPTYTIDTVREFHEQFPEEEFVLLLGSDAFNGLSTWKDFQTIVKLIDIVVAIRPGEKLAEISGANVRVVESEMFAISSTEIRHAARTGAQLDKFVPEVIIEDVRRIYGS